ncbi:MAG: hypothetical protein ACOY3X_00825 [Pseudomonadota bacterium]
MSTPRNLRLAAILLSGLLLAGTGLARAALPAGYTFSSIADAIPETAEYKTQFADQQFSVATATNNLGVLYGFRVTTAGQVRAINIKFGANPAMTAVDSDDFAALSAADVSCWWILCNTEFPFGIRVLTDDVTGDTSAVTAFLNTPDDATAVPGSLPFMEYPGNFVDENKAGVVATTQMAAGTQYGLLIHAAGQVVLDDVPWLVAINDLAEPLVLAYGRLDGACLVFGEDCAPDPDECDDDDDHHHGGGRGHEEHGNGHGYGHHKCDDDHGHGSSTGGDLRTVRTVAPAEPDGALMIRLLADGSTVRYRFPSTVVAGDAVRQVASVFPLAINADRAVLRGDITVGSTVYEKRLLSCTFDPAALDAGADGTLDCTGGMTVIGGIAGSIRAGTVLGFALDNAGVLTGNFGYNAAGIGHPFLVDVTAATPVAESLVNLAVQAEGWELNTVTDMNHSGRLVGYGYRNCKALPEAFFLDASVTAPAGGLRFVRGALETPAWLEPGDALDIRPAVTGGSGSYQYRTWMKTPADADWTLLADWTTGNAHYDTGSYTGDVCFRMEVRDTAAPEAVREQVVRYNVSEAETVTPEEGGDGTDLGVEADENSLFEDLIGAAGGLLPALLAILLLRRRR